MEVRTGKLVNKKPPGLFTEHTDRFIVDNDDMDSDTIPNVLASTASESPRENQN